MTDDHYKHCSGNDEELEREIRHSRTFTPTEAIARMAGPGAMKGASPVSLVTQAETEIGAWLRDHLSDPDGALQASLHRRLRGSEGLLTSLDSPLAALAEHCRWALSSDYVLAELVREADVEWGQRMDEPPRFAESGFSPSLDDPYTIESVRRALYGIVTKLAESAGR
jgi:hypothetical protein